MVQQADLIGFGSISIVLSACFFIGVALALNSATTLGSASGRARSLANWFAIGMVRELGPVLAGLVVAGRNASGMASELGSMVVTEQIDAMRALGTDPMKKLVTPRVISTMFMLFFLTISGGLAGPDWRVHGLRRVAGSGFPPVLEYGVAVFGFFGCVHRALQTGNLSGLLWPTIGCYYGLSTTGGTQGVGRATTEAVVAAMILIIAVDVFVTRLLMVLLGAT